MATRSL